MSPQDKWMKDALDVMIGIGVAVAGDVAKAMPGNGVHEQAKAVEATKPVAKTAARDQPKAAEPTKPERHVTVIDDRIVVHGKDDPLVEDPKVRQKLDLDRAKQTEE